MSSMSTVSVFLDFCKLSLWTHMTTKISSATDSAHLHVGRQRSRSKGKDWTAERFVPEAFLVCKGKKWKAGQRCC
jgi:hypothetical protein